MFDKIILTCDPIRPLSKIQQEDHRIFLRKLIGLNDQNLPGRFEAPSEPLSWASRYYGEAYKIEPVPHNTLVIGYELSPATQNSLHQARIPFISINIHHIRFCDDLFIRLLTNVNEIYDELSTKNINDEVFIEAAKRIKDERRKRRRPMHYKGNILVEQLPMDASTIHNNKLLGVGDVVDYFKLKNYRILHHPFSNTLSFRGLYCDAYDLFSLCEDIEMFGISSSATYEATYFDIKSHRIFDFVQASRSNVTHQLSLDYNTIKQIGHSFLSRNLLSTEHTNESIRSILRVEWRRSK